MWARVLEIVRKELKTTLRDPRMRLFLFGPPLIQLLIFGYAVNLDVEDSRVAWLDQDNSVESRRLRSEFEGSTYFRITHYPSSEKEAERLLDAGAVVGVVSILPGFSREILSGQPASLQILLDGTNSNTASIVGNYAGRIVGRFSESLGQRHPVPGPPRGIQLESRIWFNPELRSQDYYVPGVLVNLIGLLTVMLTAMAIVREKEIGTIEQLMVTPIRPYELMLGKTLPFAGVGLLQAVLITIAALLIFGIPLRGSLVLLLGCGLLFILTTLGTGLLISTLSQTQQQAMMSSFFFFLPAFLLSGFAFPISSMPPPVQFITLLNPMRHFLTIVRGVFLKGVGFETLWPQMLLLLGLGLAMITLASSRFRKTLA